MKKIELALVLLGSVILLSSCQIFSGKASSRVVDASCPTPDESMKVVLQGPSYATSGKCSGAFHVAVGKGVVVSESQELQMHASCDPLLFKEMPVAADTPVRLDGGSGSFYKDQNCTQAVDQALISAGESHQVVYYLGQKQNDELVAEPIQLKLEAPSLAATHPSITLTNGYATELSIEGPMRVNTGSCTKFSLTRKDAAGNPAIRPEVVEAGLDVVGAVGRELFYSDSGCKKAKSEVRIPAGKASGDFYFRGNLEKLSKIYLMSYEQGEASALRPARHTVVVAP